MRNSNSGGAKKKFSKTAAMTDKAIECHSCRAVVAVEVDEALRREQIPIHRTRKRLHLAKLQQIKSSCGGTCTNRSVQ